MSVLPISNLECVAVRDPRVVLNNKRYFSVMNNGADIRIRNWPATNVSNSVINFITPPSSADIITDRAISITVPFNLQITALVQPGYSVLQPNCDAPHKFPFHSVLNNCVLSLNNSDFTVQTAETFHPLNRYNCDEEVIAEDNSSCPSYDDQTQNFYDLYGENRNPLAAAGNSASSITPRGGFPFTVVTNPTNNTDAAALFTASVDCITTEYIQLSPLSWNKLRAHTSGLYNLTTLNWSFNLLNYPQRMWSHMDVPVGGPSPNWTPQSSITGMSLNLVNLVNFSYNVTVPTLNITSFSPTPALGLGPNSSITWDYYSVVNFPKDQGTSIAYGQSSLLKTDNIQLSGVPRHIYLYVRPPLSTYYSSYNSTESYYAIDAINITFGNRSGILSESSNIQLWEMSRQNGCNIEYGDFVGLKKYTVGGSTFNNVTSYCGVGAILKLELGTQIPLPEGVSPGSEGQYTIQVNVLARNINPRTQAYDVNLNPYPIPNPLTTLNLTIVYEGCITIPSAGVIYPQLNVLTKDDVLRAAENGVISYDQVREVNGGMSVKSVKEAALAANDFLRKTRLLSNAAKAASYIPAPIPGFQTGARIASDALHAVGYGDGMRHKMRHHRGGDVVGGDVVGGRMMHHGSLRDRLMNR